MIHILWGLVGAQDAEYPRDGVLHLLLPGYHFWTAFFLQGLRALHSGRISKRENTTKRTHLDKLPWREHTFATLKTIVWRTKLFNPQQGPPDNKSCILPVLRKTINGSIAMALNVMGRKRFDPKTIAEPRFINNTNIDQKMTGRFWTMNFSWVTTVTMMMLSVGPA